MSAKGNTHRQKWQNVARRQTVKCRKNVRLAWQKKSVGKIKGTMCGSKTGCYAMRCESIRISMGRTITEAERVHAIVLTGVNVGREVSQVVALLTRLARVRIIQRRPAVKIIKRCDNCEHFARSFGKCDKLHIKRRPHDEQVRIGDERKLCPYRKRKCFG